MRDSKEDTKGAGKLKLARLAAANHMACYRRGYRLVKGNISIVFSAG